MYADDGLFAFKCDECVKAFKTISLGLICSKCQITPQGTAVLEQA